MARKLVISIALVKKSSIVVVALENKSLLSGAPEADKCSLLRTPSSPRTFLLYDAIPCTFGVGTAVLRRNTGSIFCRSCLACSGTKKVHGESISMLMYSRV